MARMTRPLARELAMRICYGMSANGRSAEELLGEIFDPEYYSTFSEEDEVFAAIPEEKEKE